MQWLVDQPGGSDKVSEMIAAAGGKVVGRTRLQKMFYLAKESGFAIPFAFEYKHYGPYSDELTRATSMGCLEGLIQEEEHSASWGGTYSIYTTTPRSTNSQLGHLLAAMNDANSIDLELVATAVFIRKQENLQRAWEETVRRKPEKSHRVDQAKDLYRRISQITVPVRLPVLN